VEEEPEVAAWDGTASDSEPAITAKAAKVRTISLRINPSPWSMLQQHSKHD
jgi:hypothetical protein